MNNNFSNMYLSSKLIHLYTIFFQETLKNRIKIFFFQEIIRCKLQYNILLQPTTWQFLLCSDSFYCVLTVLTVFWQFLLCSASYYCVLTDLTVLWQFLLCSDRSLVCSGISYCVLTVLTVLWQIFSVFWQFLLCSDRSLVCSGRYYSVL